MPAEGDTRFDVLLAISIIALGCTDLFSMLDNPADPDSYAYQGFETVINVDDVRPNYSDYGESIFVPNLIATKVLGEYASELMARNQKIGIFRNKFIAHIDRHVALEKKEYYLGIEEDMHAFFTNLQRYCDAVGIALGVGPLDFRTLAGPGDTVDLIRKLRRL